LNVIIAKAKISEHPRASLREKFLSIPAFNQFRITMARQPILSSTINRLRYCR